MSPTTESISLKVQCSKPVPVLMTQNGPLLSTPTSDEHERFLMDTCWDRESYSVLHFVDAAVPNQLVVNIALPTDESSK